MHPLKSDFDHKLTEKLGVKVTKYHKESRLFQLIIKLEYTLRSFQIKFLSQFMVKIRFQGVHWKAEFLQISKLSLDMNFEQDLRQIIDLQTRRPFFWDTVQLYYFYNTIHIKTSQKGLKVVKADQIADRNNGQKIISEIT